MPEHLNINDVRFREKPIEVLTRDELIEALMQALNHARLLEKGRESGVRLTTPFDTAISEETKAALAAIDKDTKHGL